MSKFSAVSGLFKSGFRTLKGGDETAAAPRFAETAEGAPAIDAATIPAMTFVGPEGETRLDFAASAGRLWTLQRWAQTELADAKRVGLLLPLGEDLILAWTALIAAGKEPVILQYFNDRQQRTAWVASIENTYEKARLDAVIYAQEVAGLGLADHLRLVFLPPDRGAADAPPFLIPLSATFLQLSSGTTGHRKAIRFELGDVVRHSDDYGKVMKYGPQDVLVSWLPLYHDMGFIACFLTSIVQRVPLVIMDPIFWVRDPAVLNTAVERHGGTIVYLPNFGFEVMARAPGQANLKSVRHWISCSEPTYAETIEKFVARYGVPADRVSVCYAMAENIFAVTQSEGFKVVRDEAGAFVSCGRPIPDVEIKIVDDEVFVKSPVSLDRYVDGDSIRDAEGFYPTGDLGRLIDGELVISGRKGDLVNIAGRKYYLNDLDNIVNQLDPTVKGRAASLSIRHSGLGTEQAVVLIEDAQFYERDPAGLIEQVREVSGIESLDIEYVPPKFVSKTTSGKINRKKTAADWAAALAWRREQAQIARPPLAAELARAFPKARRDAPVGEALDSLGVTMLQVMLSDRGLAYDPALAMNDYLGMAEPKAEGAEGGKAVSLVSIGENSVFGALEDSHLARLGETLGKPVVFEHIIAPPSGVLLSDLIFHDYFLPRLSAEEAAPYASFRRMIGRIKAAAVLILDDVSEHELSNQQYMVLSHDFVRQPESDLMVTRHYRYVQDHHLLPTRVVRPNRELPPVAESQAALGRYLQAPIYRMAIFKDRPWAGLVTDWEFQDPFLQHPLPPPPWPVDMDAVLADIGERVKCWYGENVKLAAREPSAPAIRREGMPHMCCDLVLPQKLDPLLAAYDRFLIVGPEASMPYIGKKLTEMGKVWLHCTANDFTTAGIGEDQFDAVIQAGAWGKPPTTKPAFQLITAGWADDQWRALQPGEHWFRRT